MNKKMLETLNAQMNREFESAYIYLAMVAYFESENLSGFSAWMKKQYSEEIEHAMKFFHYIVERGETPVLKGFDTPQASYASPLAAFKKALEHEQYITANINTVADVAAEVDDKPTQIFIQWYITEQVEEEDNVGTVVNLLEKVGDNINGLLFVDRQLAARGE